MKLIKSTKRGGMKILGGIGEDGQPPRDHQQQLENLIWQVLVLYDCLRFETQINNPPSSVTTALDSQFLC